MHSVVAAALADPDRLTAWSMDPSLLAQFGVEPTEFDLEAVADFAGLSEKIRHNGCRAHLRMTFQLLNLTGLEIQLFRDYAPWSLRRRAEGLTSPMYRIDGLALFIGGWAEGGDPLRTLLRDVLRHEHAVACLRTAQIDHERSCPEVEPSSASIPARNGELVVRTFTCDPRQVQQVLEASPVNLGDIGRGARTFVYQRTADRLRALEVARPVGDLLTAVDGRRSVDQISAQLFGTGADRSALLRLLEQLVEIGLLRWVNGGANR